MIPKISREAFLFVCIFTLWSTFTLSQDREAVHGWQQKSLVVQCYVSVMPLLELRNYNIGIEILRHKESFHMGIRAGLSFGAELDAGIREFEYMAAPHLAGVFFWGSKNWHPELTAGLVAFPYEAVYVQMWPILNAGVRYQSPQKPFVFRSAFGTGGFGIGIGYRL
jgi:hypothetical protein